VSTGQRVRIVNELGAFTAVADVRDDVVSGVVICPHGRWRSRGPTPNASTPAGLSDLGRGPTFSDALVEVEPLPRRLAGAESVEAPAPHAPRLGHVGRDAAAEAANATERRAPG
jgi:Molydopterin dinucleotide binding domain